MIYGSRFRGWFNVAIVVVICVVLILFGHLKMAQYHNHQQILSSRRLSIADSVFDLVHRSLFEWGNTFGVVIESHYNNLHCQSPVNGQPLCCELVNKDLNKLYPRPPVKHDRSRLNTHTHCHTKKTYIPSEYEVSHFNKAVEIQKLNDELHRRDMLLDFFFEDIPHANIWLERVKVHMASRNVTPTDEDYKYLSRYEVKRECGVHSESWIEWIEPLVAQARHPFSIKACNMGNKMYHKPHEEYAKRADQLKHPTDGLCNVDYVLLQDDNHLPKASSRFFLDAGTSTFNSGMFWFICSYIRRMISFDHIYGWEYTLLEPTNFWNLVPPMLLPIYHFYNAPVSKEPDAQQNVWRLIREMAKPDDFVSFKLDIDTPSVEIPLALQLLSDKGGNGTYALSELVDEFFFELHFQCELLQYCGWGINPPETNGFILDRVHALQYFRQVRDLGVRAHIWP